MSIKKSIKGFRKFHGKNPEKLNSIDFHIPKNLILLGKAVAIEYECTKLHGGGNGKSNVFRHCFDDDTLLCMDEKAKHQLYIIGEDLKVTQAGIEN